LPIRLESTVLSPRKYSPRILSSSDLTAEFSIRQIREQVNRWQAERQEQRAREEREEKKQLRREKMKKIREEKNALNINPPKEAARNTV